MRKVIQNTFGDGLIKDLNPLTTPNTCLTDALNATLITYNGNEFVLQNDMGNCQVERAKLSPGFIPLGVKEYGGVIYIASYNPDTDECELGSFPSPERDITGTNAIEYQTGLTDGHFSNEDFSLPVSRINGEFIPDEILFKIQKLNEPEVLKLNPGDKFITTYKLSPESGIEQDDFDLYFSFDPNRKALFQVTFYKIDSNNNINEMDPEDVKTIPYRTNIDEDEYTYYVESNGGTIAVGVALTPLRYFNSNVREFSKRADSNKKIRIEALGQSDSDVLFEGIRVDVIKNESENDEETTTFHVAKISDTQDKVSASVSDLEEGDKVKVEVTPYSQFSYFPNLMQTFNLEMGKNLNGTDLNNVFKWYVRENVNRLELEFDFTYEVENDSKMYLEFYDPWSNISTFKVIQSPSIYSNMNVSLTLVDEPRTNHFDNYTTANTLISKNQKGGVSFSKLYPYVEGVQEPLLVNPNANAGMRLIRKDEALRKNHFYIVRICLYEENENENGEIERKYYNYYKALYTNTAYNALYEEQKLLSIEDIDYKPDFTKIAYPIDRLQFSGVIEKEFPSVINSTVPSYDMTHVTDYKGYNYFFNLNSRPSTQYVSINTLHEVKKQYNVKLDKKTNLHYGYLKSDLLDIENISTESVSNIIDTVDANNPIVSTAALNFNKIDDINAIANLTLNTTRPVRSKVQNAEANISRTNVKLSDYMYEKNTDNFGGNTPLYYDTTAISIGRNRRGGHDNETYLSLNVGNRGIEGIIRLPKIDGWNTANHASHELTQNGKTHDVGTDSNAYNKSVVNKVDRLHEETSKQFFSTLLNHKYNFNQSKGLVVGWIKNTGVEENTWFNVGITFMAKSDSSPRTVIFPIKTNDLNNINRKVKTFLDNLYHIQITTAPESQGYYLNSNFDYYENEETRIDNINLTLRTTWNLPSIKTYLFRALYGDPIEQDFSTIKINTLILDSVSRAGVNHTFLNEDEDSPLEDNGFIPYVDSTTDVDNFISNVSLGEFSVDLSSDAELRHLFGNSQQAYEDYIDETRETDNSVLEKIYVISNPPETYKESLIEFSNLFKYNPNANDGNKIQLVNEGGNFTYKVAARNSDKGLYRLYMFDAYNKILRIE